MKRNGKIRQISNVGRIGIIIEYRKVRVKVIYEEM